VEIDIGNYKRDARRAKEAGVREARATYQGGVYGKDSAIEEYVRQQDAYYKKHNWYDTNADGTAVADADEDRQVMLERWRKEAEDMYAGMDDKGAMGYIDESELDLDAAYDKAMGLVETGMGEMKTEYEGAIERFDPYAQQGKKALDLYMSMFSGGDGGAANIMNTPMFKAQQSEMNKQIAAQMAATGRGGSMKSIESTFAPAQQQLMRQAYGDYFRQLSPIVGYGYSATASQAGLQSDLGRRMMAGRTYQSGLEQQRGLGKSQLDQQRSSLAYQSGLNMANLDFGEAAIEADYKMQLANSWDNILNSAATFAGSMMGGGSNIMGPSYGGQGYGQYGGYA
jgi:hypothetical protein